MQEVHHTHTTPHAVKHTQLRAVAGGGCVAVVCMCPAACVCGSAFVPRAAAPLLVLPEGPAWLLLLLLLLLPPYWPSPATHTHILCM